MNKWINFKKSTLLTTVLILCAVIPLISQEATSDFFGNIGKIYVVVTVVAISFLGILFYLIFLDRKIRKMEKKLEE